MTPTRTTVGFNSSTRVISLTTRTFYFWRKSKHKDIDEIYAVDALNRDALTHDEIFVRFYADDGGLVVSEFDDGFQDLIEALKFVFPGIERWNDVTPAVPLTEAALLLWSREVTAERRVLGGEAMTNVLCESAQGRRRRFKALRLRSMRLDLLALFLLPLLFGAPSSNALATDGIVVCTSLPANASLIKTDGGHRLVFTVENPTDTALDLMAFYFESDALRLSAVEKEGNRPLRTLVPLVTPGVAPVRIRAGEKFVFEFDLASIFPDLESALRRSAVAVSWRLKLDPGPGCFSEVAETTVTIPKLGPDLVSPEK